jgi:hypothetical protein
MFPHEEILVCILDMNNLHTKYHATIIKIHLHCNGSAGHLKYINIYKHINVSAEG